MLHEFVTANRDEIIRRCREKVAKRSIPEPSEAELDHGVPLFLDQLVEALRSGNPSAAQIDRSASQHGHDLLLQGFTVSQVVHDYGDVCQTITELAVENHAPISTEDFKTLNRCLDEAIAGAVTRFSRETELRASATHSEATGRTNERVGFLVHELRNLVHTAIVAFEVIKTGNVGAGGSTGGILDRTLSSLRDLIAQSLDDVRMAKGATKRERVVMADFIDHVSQAARLAADARDITFVVAPVPAGTAVEADQQILSAVVGNLLQNAFKFTRPHSTVTLQVGASAERVLIQVQDECGGLPGEGDGKELFHPFEQRGADRSGLGIGLAFSRWGAEANGGRLYTRNMAGKGCVFTVDLPRSPVTAGNAA
jgi:signal transduction histidine kinase